MGSCASNKSGDGTGSQENDPDPTLTAHDVELIRASWKLIPKTEFGTYGQNMMIM
jgi:hypothetical protein